MIILPAILCFPIALLGHIPPPESFDEIKRQTDLIGIVRVEQISDANPFSVTARIVEVFNGQQTQRLIRVVWPLVDKPLAGAAYYAFLKKGDDDAFYCRSHWWRFYRVTEPAPSKELVGRKIYHSDCYWVLTSNSACRYSYSKKSTVTSWPVDHVIQRGDSLVGLAARFYGDSTRWRRIWQRNAWIQDPGQLQVGWKVQIPNISDYD